jgi:ABC-type protease/lipase transport system fused ATPase/permease subunit
LGAGAFVLADIALFFLFLTLTFILDTWMELWLAALITTLVAGAIAAVVAMQARNQMKQVSPAPKRFMKTMEEDMQWARSLMKSRMR